MVLSKGLVSLLSVGVAHVSAAAYFPFEQDHLTSENIHEILNDRLPKQSRIQGSDFSNYTSTFLFSPTDVTSNHNSSVNYDLKGPDNCKVFPGDINWPSQQIWAGLKAATLGGLVQAVPMSHVCYANGTGEVDEAACTDLAESWNTAKFIAEDLVESMSPHEIGLTCQPSSLLDTEGCTQGGYPTYTVNVSSVSQIQLAVNVARNTGTRFVIANTGHDFLGKSSGAGSLSVWMHGLKDMEYIPSYNSSSWTGAAVKAGAGVQGFEMYDFAYRNNATTIGGLCVTVGVLGGWFQGGGHSPLSPLFGMGADQVLSIEVVTADGRFVTASPEENTDLFWALRGGGAGTWGVVTSVTTKAYPSISATTATWSFSYPADVSESIFKQAMRSWLSYFPRYADAGLYSYLNVVPSPDGLGHSFIMDPLILPNQSLSAAEAILEPWMKDIKELGIDLEPEFNYYEQYKGEALTNGSANNYGSLAANRLFPRENFEDPELFNATFDALWQVLQDGFVVLPYNNAPTYDRGGRPNNAINPAWREAIAYIIIGATVDYTQSAEEIMEGRYNFTNGPMQSLRDVTEGSGSYGNEGDRLEPNFQWSFFGSHYPRLLELKKRYDPFNLFYAVTGVGSEFFEVRSFDGYANENGRLCRKAEPVLYVAEGPDWEAPTEE